MVGHLQMEYRGQLELRQVPRAGRLDHHALHADRFPLPPRPIGRRRTPGSLRTESLGLLFDVRRDVFTGHHTNRSSRRSLSSDLVRSVCWTICGAGWRWTDRPPAGLQPVLRMVPTDHALGLGARGETISRGQHDDCLGAKDAGSALSCHPLIPRPRIGNGLHDAHVAKAIFEIGMGTHAALRFDRG